MQWSGKFQYLAKIHFMIRSKGMACRQTYIKITDVRCHTDVMIWRLMFVRLESTETQPFVQLMAQTNIKENLKLSITGPLWEEFSGPWWILLIK